MFEKEILDDQRDIPKVFRTGLLKSDTASSLSRRMSEIERNQPSEYGNDEVGVNQPGRNGLPGKHSGNTSVDSMMEDTPSNYNDANQRFDPNYQNLTNAARKNVPVIDEEDSNYDYEVNAAGQKVKKMKKKKVV